MQSSFIDNIWVDGFADMQLINKFNKGIPFLLRVTDIFSKYAWVVSLKDKKDIAITNVFQIWVDKGSSFHNRSMRSWVSDKIRKCIQKVMNGNLFMLKNLLKP